MSLYEYARREAQRGDAAIARTAGKYQLRKWLESSAGEDTLDEAVLGGLGADDYREIASDFGVTVSDVAAAIRAALAKGF